MPLFKKKSAPAPDPVEVGLSQQSQALSLFDEAVAGLDESNATLNLAYQESDEAAQMFEQMIQREREKQRLINDAVNKNVRVREKVIALTQ